MASEVVKDLTAPDENITRLWSYYRQVFPTLMCTHSGQSYARDTLCVSFVCTLALNLHASRNYDLYGFVFGKKNMTNSLHSKAFLWKTVRDMFYMVAWPHANSIKLFSLYNLLTFVVTFIYAVCAICSYDKQANLLLIGKQWIDKEVYIFKIGPTSNKCEQPDDDACL